MPYSFDLLEQEQKKKQNGEVNELGAPAMTGGGQQFNGSGAASGQSSQSQGAPQQKGTNTQGSGFVGLDQYMKANQGNQLGAQVTGRVQSAVDQGKKALEEGASGFANASNQGAKKWNDVEGDVKSIVDNAGANTTEDDAKKVQANANAVYQGPESFLNTTWGTQAQGAAQKANQQAKALQTEGGRFALLDQYFGRPTYSHGQKALDNLLVQNDRSTAAKAQNLGTQSNALSSSGVEKTKDLDNLAAANRAATAEAAKNTRDYLNSSTASFNQSMNSKLASEIERQKKARADFESRLASNRLTQEDLDLIGLPSGERLYGISLNDPSFVNSYIDPTLYQTASAEDFARAAALSQLIGETDSSILPKSYKELAGTYKDDPFNEQGFRGKLASAKDAYQRDFESAQREYEEAQANKAALGSAFLEGLIPSQYFDKYMADADKFIQAASDKLQGVERKYGGAVNAGNPSPMLSPISNRSRPKIG